MSEEKYTSFLKITPFSIIVFAGLITLDLLIGPNFQPPTQDTEPQIRTIASEEIEVMEIGHGRQSAVWQLVKIQ